MIRFPDAPRGLVQVAGVVDEEEAHMLAEAGVHQIGFPLRLAVHKEDVSEEEAARIILSLKYPASAILITYLSGAEEVLTLCRKLGLHRVQLHSDISLAEVSTLRKLGPGISVIKSLVIKGFNYSELERCVIEFSPHVDGFITDTYDPETGASGATGKTHDWSISRRLVEMSPRPVILAGGLNPSNVWEAILRVRPAGVDVHTGVERPDGSKDPELVKAFVDRANEAFGLFDSHTSAQVLDRLGR